MNNGQRRRLKRVRLANALGRLPREDARKLSDWIKSFIGPDALAQIASVEADLMARVVPNASAFGLKQSYVLPTAKLREKLDWLMAGVMSGDTEVCPHIGREPRPVFWAMGTNVIHCGCTKVHFDAIQDFTCDFCGQYHEGDCIGHCVMAGPMLVTFGTCTACDAGLQRV